MSDVSCTICGSNRNQNIDGKLYCLGCNSQITTYQEYAVEEDTAIKGTFKLKTAKKARRATIDTKNVNYQALGMASNNVHKIKRKGFVSQPTTSKEFESESVCVDKLRKDFHGYTKKTGDHLKVVGKRLLTFTKIIAKVARTLIDEYDFPIELLDSCLSLWQFYLKHCQVAFHNSEYTSDENKMFRAIIEKKQTLLENYEEKMKKVEKKKARASMALNKSMNPFDLLMSQDIDENLAMNSDHDDDEVDGDVKRKPVQQMIEVIDTFIEKSTIKRAEKIYLEVDLLASIVYVACLSIGCRWVVLSDIVRWISEDRFFISKFESVSIKNQFSRKCNFSEGLPLFEYHRTMLWFWQSINRPFPAFEFNIQQIFARFLYDLNLPTDFMDCVLCLYRLFPIDIEVSEKSLKRQGDIDEGFPCASMCKSNNWKNIQNCFGRYHTQMRDVFLTLETKIFAYILLALKLRFGLEDIADSLQHHEGDFNVSSWIYQLRMRLLHMQGYSASEILQEGLPFNSHKIDPVFGHGGNTIFRKGEFRGKSSYVIISNKRDACFAGGCPEQRVIEQVGMLPPYFPSELSRKPVRVERGNKVLFAPLRHQTSVLKDHLNQMRSTVEREEMKKIINKKCLNLFSEDFGICDLGIDSSSDWKSLFPNSSSYKKYPKPLWSQGSVQNLLDKEKNPKMKGIDQKYAYSPCSVFLSRKSCNDVFIAGAPYMSSSFSTILQSFATLIGEFDFMLYACFTILELQLTDRQRHMQIVEDLVRGATLEANYAVIDPSGHSKNFNGRISALNSNVSSIRDVNLYKLGYPKDYAIPIADEFFDEPEEFSETDSDSDMEEEDDIGSEENNPTTSSTTTTSYKSGNIVKEEHDKPNVKDYYRRNRFSSVVYDWATIWHILGTRYW